MTGGLGRTLAEIRADIDTPPVRGVLTVEQRGALSDRGPVGRLIRDVVRIAEGAAEDEPPEFGTPTAAQWWARLLTLEPAVRLEAIDRLLRAAVHAENCWRLDHEGRYQLLERRYSALLQAVHEGASVEILLADDAPVGWVPA